MAETVNQHKIKGQIIGFRNICLSTIAFTLLFLSLVLYSVDIIALAFEVRIIHDLLLVFAFDQIFLKPILAFITNNPKYIEKLDEKIRTSIQKK